MKEEFVDSLVINVDAVNVEQLMEKGLKYKENNSQSGYIAGRHAPFDVVRAEDIAQ